MPTPTTRAPSSCATSTSAAYEVVAARRALRLLQEPAGELDDVGPDGLKRRDRLRGDGQVVECEHRAALAVGRGEVAEQVRVGVVIGLHQLEAELLGPAPDVLDHRPGAAQGAFDVEDRAQVELDEQALARGQQRHAGLDRRRPGAGVEGEEGVVGDRGTVQLGARHLAAPERAAHEGLAGEDGAVGQVDDRLEDRVHPAAEEEPGEPVGAQALEHDGDGDGDAGGVLQAHGEDPGALGGGQRLDRGLQAVLDPWPRRISPVEGGRRLDGCPRAC